jgi:hypothetical protein
MESLIRKVLDHCGYNEDEATIENLTSCFIDFVDGGIFGNLTVEEALEEIETGDISVKLMCYNLLKVR